MVKRYKIAAWDLETSSLNANGGFIICASVGDPNKLGKIKSYRVDKYRGWKDDPWNDCALVADLVAYLNDADLWITYYGKRFDLPFLTTRVLYWRGRGVNIDLPSNVPHVDLYDTARRRLKLHSNRLQVVSDLLGHGEKTPLELPTWIKAAGGHRPSIQYIVEHCEKDVEILSRNYVDLRPLVRAHPHLGVLQGSGAYSCAACGGSNVQRRGTYATEATRRQRFFCTDCGRWGSVPFRESNNNKKERSSGRGRSKTPGTAQENGGHVGEQVHNPVPQFWS